MVRLKADCSAKEIGQNIEVLHVFGITIISVNITNTKDADQTTGMLVCKFDVCIYSQAFLATRPISAMLNK